ncbi:protein yippee-like 3 [Sturnira hondurensis]|uniref:protein yippee-like 3 n=1 Tax=Sturnira hondurensis TaxID=192404 RepID=UPI0018796CBC|nr:protein yippee-like 3 [Sturnira hondurensis]XP_036921268.1 protein yippee-like 3 [Sturnira hondurensis]XP_036921269.1 protein yippee-like 3 [Sturnira hondurensis]
MVRISKPKTFQAYLDDCHRRYSCAHCRAHLANHDDLISKSFQGSQGRAYLFNSVVNVGCGPAEERVLLTGLHAVADIHCENCKTTLGWKYWRIKPPPGTQDCYGDQIRCNKRRCSWETAIAWSCGALAMWMPQAETGTGLREQPEVQRGEVHH